MRPLERVAGGALAGLLCRQDRRHGPSAGDDGIELKRSLSPALELTETDAARLARAGINAIVRDAAGRVRLTGDCTLAIGSGQYRTLSRLTVRRLCLRITNAIDRATRWSVFATPDASFVARVCEQVADFLRRLHAMGAIESEDFVVHCNPGITSGGTAHGITLLLVFRPHGCRTPLSFTVEQTPAGCRVSTSAFMPFVADCA